ncbi:MAG: dipeptidase [Clostridiales bacterium]|nr:dipeptidase [Clostridiales bacterium]
MHLIDMHCDSLLKCRLKPYGLRRNSGHLDLESMAAAGATAQFFAVFLPSGQEAEKEGIETEPYQLFQEIYDLYQGELAENRDLILPAHSYEDIMDNMNNEKMSAVLCVEDGQLLDGKIERLDELHGKGVKLVTLLWNYENCLGYPHSSDPADHKRGLKPFGMEAVERMNQLGIIIDVSHMSGGGFDDVAKHSKKPFIASHSCARALCSHSRNLTDGQLGRIANSGGVCGVNFNAGFLKEGADYSAVSDISRHVDHMIQVMGAEGVALGSDFDGIDCRLEIENYNSMGVLVSELLKKHSTDTVEKVCYKNVLRVIKECL